MDSVCSSDLAQLDVSPNIRILLRDMPGLVRDVLEHAISGQSDIEIIREDQAVLTMPMNQSIPDVVIVGTTHTEDMQNAPSELLQWPQSLVLIITLDGHRAALYELVPHKTEFGEMSPLELVDAIRTRLKQRRL